MILISSVTKSCWTLWVLMECSMLGFLILHHLPEFAQTHVHWVGDTIQTSHPLSPPSPDLNLSQHHNLFQGVGSSHQVAKVLELQHQSFQWIFRVDLLYPSILEFASELTLGELIFLSLHFFIIRTSRSTVFDLVNEVIKKSQINHFFKLLFFILLKLLFWWDFKKGNTVLYYLKWITCTLIHNWDNYHIFQLLRTSFLVLWFFFLLASKHQGHSNHSICLEHNIPLNLISQSTLQITKFPFLDYS